MVEVGGDSIIGPVGTTKRAICRDWWRWMVVGVECIGMDRASSRRSLIVHAPRVCLVDIVGVGSGMRL